MGFGGTNSHVILDDAYHFLRDHGLSGKTCSVERPPSASELLNLLASSSSQNYERSDCKRKSRRPMLLAWSGPSEDSVRRIASSFAQFFVKLRFCTGAIDLNSYLESLAYTLNHKRSSFSYMSYMAVDSLDELCDIESQISPPICLKDSLPKIGFVFTGQGAAWAMMGKDLFLEYPAFHQSLVASANDLQDLGCKWNLIGIHEYTCS